MPAPGQLPATRVSLEGTAQEFRHEYHSIKPYVFSSIISGQFVQLIHLLVFYLLGPRHRVELGDRNRELET